MTLNFSPEYVAYMGSSEWCRMRERYFVAYGRACRRCGCPAEQVHHLTYEDPFGFEKLENLMGVCIPCHELITKYCRLNKHMTIRDVTAYVLQDALDKIPLKPRRQSTSKTETRKQRKKKDKLLHATTCPVCATTFFSHLNLRTHVKKDHADLRPGDLPRRSSGGHTSSGPAPTGRSRTYGP